MGDASSLFRVNTSGMNDKPLRRWPYIRERIAGHERQLRISRLMEDLYFAWIYDLDCVHHVSKCPVGSRDEDFIVSPKFAQRAKERISMSGDTHIPRRPRKSSTVDMPGRRSEDLWSCAFENHHGKLKARNLDSSHRLSGPGRNYDQGTRERLGVGHFRFVIPLVIEEPARRALHTEHVPLQVPIPTKKECAPGDEGAPEIDHQLLAHRKRPTNPAWFRIESLRSRPTRALCQEGESSQSWRPSVEAWPA